MNQQRREQRALLRQRAKAVRETLDQLPVVQQAKRKAKRRRMVMLTLVLLLLLLFIRCECDPTAPPPAPEVADAGTKPAPPKPKRARGPAKPPFDGRTGKNSRGTFETGEPNTPPWLDDFRMQVAARSPRLADCFAGTERPGALRWTTAVNAESGAVSDSELEPLGATGDLPTEQRSCVQRVLSSPVYRISSAASATGLPSRVSIVIEF